MKELDSGLLYNMKDSQFFQKLDNIIERKEIDSEEDFKEDEEEDYMN